MSSFALYHYPNDKHIHHIKQTQGEVAQLTDYEQLGNLQGFVLAPFAVSKHTPIVIIEEQEHDVYEFKVDKYAASSPKQHEDDAMETAEQRTNYHRDFVQFHQWLCSGKGEKLVLSRAATCSLDRVIDATLFEEACYRYPDMFVALVHTDITGTWLMATPEVFLKQEGNQWSTMALAGTMKLPDPTSSSGVDNCQECYQPQWSEKNKKEQAYVANYIKNVLQQHTQTYTQQGPYTKKAANLIHLCSDFYFQLQPDVSLGELIAHLHPTPAVCGMPKDEAYRFILEHESTNRRYYSGFAGMLSHEQDSRLYVSLRCMNLHEKQATLYAGGGILPDSEEESEWQETQAKMQTMRRLLTQK